MPITPVAIITCIGFALNFLSTKTLRTTSITEIILISLNRIELMDTISDLNNAKYNIEIPADAISETTAGLSPFNTP